MIDKKMTPYPELDAILRDHANRLQEALGNSLIGVYLVGSLVIGDFDLTSDTDFIVVTRDELSEPHVKQVQFVHDQTTTTPLWSDGPSEKKVL